MYGEKNSLFLGYTFITVHVQGYIHSCKHKHANLTYAKGEWEKSQAQPHSFLHTYMYTRTDSQTNKRTHTNILCITISIYGAGNESEHKMVQTQVTNTDIWKQTLYKHTTTNNHACSTNTRKQRVKSEL